MTAGIAAAVHGAQAGTLGYRAFCDRAAEAGCVGYIASMAGRRVVYYGRTGESHVEWFPGAGRPWLAGAGREGDGRAKEPGWHRFRAIALQRYLSPALCRFPGLSRYSAT